jgi:uncharacterized protein (DUF849 family)
MAFSFQNRVYPNFNSGPIFSGQTNRLCCLEAAPDIASLNLTPDMSRVHFRERRAPLPHPRPAEDFDGCIPFTYATVRAFAARMQEKNIRPEMEVYHPGAHWVIRDLIEAGLVKPPYLIQTVMGYQTASWQRRKQFWICCVICRLTQSGFALELAHISCHSQHLRH